jgi:hypothetical protein
MEVFMILSVGGSKGEKKQFCEGDSQANKLTYKLFESTFSDRFRVEGMEEYGKNNFNS